MLLKFGEGMPKLLLVGIIEQTCRKTVIREIPGITECFSSKADDGGNITVKMTHCDDTRVRN
jgi:hypothetical protein